MLLLARTRAASLGAVLALVLPAQWRAPVPDGGARLRSSRMHPRA
jgi:hypothetical protein